MAVAVDLNSCYIAPVARVSSYSKKKAGKKASGLNLNQCTKEKNEEKTA